jgi:hypothetical protein
MDKEEKLTALNDAEGKLLENEKMPRALCIVLTIVFIGILLSFSINFLVSAYFDIDDNYEDYYDGEVHEDIFLQYFADAFYKDTGIRDLVSSIDYLFYGNLRSDSVLLGQDGFLFDIYDLENGYNYIEDYVGESLSDRKYLESLAQGIENIRRPYIERGGQCVVVVIPNAQTVYSELMPEYFGEISDKTVLKQLTAYMNEIGAQGYADMTDTLISAKGDGLLYNNTENSLNSLGAYYVYRKLMDGIPKEYGENSRTIERSSLSLSLHYTEGKSLAKRAGISALHLNRTLSVNVDVPQNYKVYPVINGIEKTYNNDLISGAVVLLDCINEWDKIMMGDYFSNSFRLVGCSVGETQNLFETIKPDITYIFVHEYQLSMFADEN